MIKKLEEYFMEYDPQEGPVLNDKGVKLAIVILFISIILISFLE